jgi:nucleoporin SEH1
MIQTGLISPAHDDLVCEAVFDYYGTRLATCGLDQKYVIHVHYRLLIPNFWSLLTSSPTPFRIKIWRDASVSQMNDHSGGDNSNNASGSGGWILEDEFKAHDAPILSLSWAHPEFGRMLVSGSMDRTVKIWEWVPGFLGGANGGNAGSGSGAMNGTGVGPDGSRWRMHTVLTEAKGSVRAVRFAPPVFGLKFVRSCLYTPSHPIH